MVRFWPPNSGTAFCVFFGFYFFFFWRKKTISLLLKLQTDMYKPLQQASIYCHERRLSGQAYTWEVLHLRFGVNLFLQPSNLYGILWPSSSNVSTGWDAISTHTHYAVISVDPHLRMTDCELTVPHLHTERCYQEHKWTSMSYLSDMVHLGSLLLSDTKAIQSNPLLSQAWSEFQTTAAKKRVRRAWRSHTKGRSKDGSRL